MVDLLTRGSRSPGGLRVREEQQRGFYVEGLRTVPCESAAQVQSRERRTFRIRGSFSCLFLFKGPILYLSNAAALHDELSKKGLQISKKQHI